MSEKLKQDYFSDIKYSRFIVRCYELNLIMMNLSLNVLIIISMLCKEGNKNNIRILLEYLKSHRKFFKDM